MLRVPWQGNTPIDRCSADREILQPLIYEPQSLITLPSWDDKVRARFVPLPKRFLVSTQLEEIIFLFDMFHRAAMYGTTAID